MPLWHLAVPPWACHAPPLWHARLLTQPSGLGVRLPRDLAERGGPLSRSPPRAPAGLRTAAAGFLALVGGVIAGIQVLIAAGGIVLH